MARAASSGRRYRRGTGVAASLSPFFGCRFMSVLYAASRMVVAILGREVPGVKP